MDCAEVPPKFKLGDLVKVRTLDVRTHNRTPLYIRGKVGVIGIAHGRFLNPETLAYNGSGLPMRTLYNVIFKQDEVWERYTGSVKDKILIDLFEHWLEYVGTS